MLAAVLDWLADPWAQAIGRRALLEVVLLGIAGGALGCWVVFYDLAYSAESLAHALLPGLVGAALLGLPLLLGGAAGLLLGALAVALAGRVEGVGRDTGVAVVVTTLFGLGVLLALSADTPAGLQGLLFGDVLGVSDHGPRARGRARRLAARRAAGAAPAAAGRRLRPGSARALGVRPGLVDAALLLLLAGALLVAVQGLGNLLVVAVLVAPASAARLLTRRMGHDARPLGALAVLAGVAGSTSATTRGTAAGASIALALVAATASRRWRGRCWRAEGAVAAGAVEHDVVLGDVEGDAARDPVDRALELLVLERDDLAAVVADEVVVVGCRCCGS
jgi:ABC-type Mn2+/Zn2+ transport system permease subunit